MRSDKAKGIARIAHLGQLYGSGDYFDDHVTDVARRVFDDPRADDNVLAVAWLHDVIEDTLVDEDLLTREGLNVRQHLALNALTRYEGEDYEKYIDRVCTNRDAMIVKYHDISANLAAGPPVLQAHKYIKARIQVQAELARAKP